MNTATATIEGNYNQAAAGTLKIKLGGTATGQFDRLSVTGNVSLGGTLTVTLVNSFTPVPGNSFQIITFLGTLAGDFATKNFPALGNGNKFTTSSSPGAYTLSVIA
jgi:outer membrane autotransporter protein